jgi:hypothetical protein
MACAHNSVPWHFRDSKELRGKFASQEIKGFLAEASTKD